MKKFLREIASSWNPVRYLFGIGILWAAMSCSSPNSETSPQSDPTPKQPTDLDQTILGTWGSGTWGAPGSHEYVFTKNNIVYQINGSTYYTLAYSASGGTGSWWPTGTTDPRFDFHFTYSVSKNALSIQGFGSDVSGTFPYISASQANPGGGSSKADYTFSGSSVAVNAIVNVLYPQALNDGGSGVQSYANPVAPTPYAEGSIDIYLAACEIDAWGVALEAYKGDNATVQSLLSAMMQNFKNVWLLHSTGTSGSPDSLHYSGITYLGISNALQAYYGSVP